MLRRKDKRKSRHIPNGPGGTSRKRKSPGHRYHSSEASFDRGTKRKRGSPPRGGPRPEDQTQVEGFLYGNPYLLADRLERVNKLGVDRPFYDRYQEDPFGHLGKGNFGSVVKFTDRKTNRLYAVKTINKEQIWQECPMPVYKVGLYCEAAVFTQIIPRHRNIIDMVRICESPKFLYYVMECLSKFDLKQSFRGFTPAEARRCFFRILQAVDHLHQHGVIHGDLKLENICVRQSDLTDPILIDFGHCQFNPRMVRKRKPSFNFREVFTACELNEMSGYAPSTGMTPDVKELADILEMFTTGESYLCNMDLPGYPRFNPKPDAAPDALALLAYMRDKKKMGGTTVEQLMQHIWFDPERAVMSAMASYSRSSASVIRSAAGR